MYPYGIRSLAPVFRQNNILMFETERLKGFSCDLEAIFPEILGNAEKSPTINFTSWGKSNLFALESPNFQRLQKLVAICLNRFTEEFWEQYRGKKPNYATCWANVVKKYRAEGAPHRHHSNPFNLVAVYYAEGDYRKKRGGTLFWLKEKGRFIKHEVAPKVGSLLFFPSTIAHAISDYESSNPRITFGVDIRFKREDFYSHPCCLLDEAIK